MSFTALVKSKVTLIKFFLFFVLYLLFFFTLGFLKTNIVKAKSISGVTPGAFVSENFRIEPTKEVTSNTVNLCLYAPEDNFIQTAGGIQDRLADSNESNIIGKLLNNFIQTESKKLASTLFVKTSDGKIPMNRALIQDITEGKYNYLSKKTLTNSSEKNQKKEAINKLYSPLKQISDTLIRPIYAQSYFNVYEDESIEFIQNLDPQSGTKYNVNEDRCIPKSATCVEPVKNCRANIPIIGDAFCTTTCNKWSAIDRDKYLECFHDQYDACTRADFYQCNPAYNTTLRKAMTCPVVKWNKWGGIECPGDPLTRCNQPNPQICGQKITEQAASGAIAQSDTTRCIEATKDENGNSSSSCFDEDPDVVQKELANAFVAKGVAEAEKTINEKAKIECQELQFPESVCGQANVTLAMLNHAKELQAQGSTDREKINRALGKLEILRRECRVVSDNSDDACDSEDPEIVLNATNIYQKLKEEELERQACFEAGIDLSICSAPKSQWFAKAKQYENDLLSEDRINEFISSSCVNKVQKLAAKGYNFDSRPCTILPALLASNYEDSLPNPETLATFVASIGDCSGFGVGWFKDDETNACLPPIFARSNEAKLEDWGPLTIVGGAYLIGKGILGTPSIEVTDILRNQCFELFRDFTYSECAQADAPTLVDINTAKIKEKQEAGEELPPDVQAVLNTPVNSDSSDITPQPNAISTEPVDLDPKRVPPGKIRALCENQSVACTAYAQPLNSRADSVQDRTLRESSPIDLADNLRATGNRVDREDSDDGIVQVVREYDSDGKPIKEYVYSEGQLVQVNSYYKDEEDNKVRSVIRYDAEECGGDGCRNYYVEQVDEEGNRLTSTTINEKVDGQVEVLTHKANDVLELEVYEDREELDLDLADALGIEENPIDLSHLDRIDALEGSVFGGGDAVGGPDEVTEPTAGDGDPDAALEETASDYENLNPQGFWCWDGTDWYVGYDWNECATPEFIPEEPQYEGEYVEPEYTEPEYTDPVEEEPAYYEPDYEAVPDSETDDSNYVYPNYYDDEVLGVQSKRVVPSGKSGGVFCDMPLSEKVAKIEIENLDIGGSPKVFIEDPIALYDYSREGLAWQVAPLKNGENQVQRNIKVTFYVRSNPKDENFQTYSTNLTITLKRPGFIEKVSNPGSFLNNLRKLLPI